MTDQDKMREAASIDELAKLGPHGRSTLYKEIKEGRLVARKCRGRTIILFDDYRSWLKHLPKFCGSKNG